MPAVAFLSRSSRPEACWRARCKLVQISLRALVTSLGLAPEDLSLDLGPLGTLLPRETDC